MLNWVWLVRRLLVTRLWRCSHDKFIRWYCLVTCRAWRRREHSTMIQMKNKLFLISIWINENMFRMVLLFSNISKSNGKKIPSSKHKSYISNSTYTPVHLFFSISQPHMNLLEGWRDNKLGKCYSPATNIYILVHCNFGPNPTEQIKMKAATRLNKLIL